MHAGVKGAVALLVAALVIVLPATEAHAAGAVCDLQTGECTVIVTDSPTTGPGGGGSTPGKDACLRDDAPVPCTSTGGTWSNALQCYLKLADPQPPASDPVWGGHSDGAMYWCSTSFGLAPVSRLVWLATPPSGPTPEELARRALNSLTVPRPLMRRSPIESNADGGVPYTWVNLWTWVWTEPQTWSPMSARAAAGTVWAEVEVTPAQMRFAPGDGSTGVVCPGPGRPWQEADGNAAPSAGGCGYRYKHVAAAPVTATLSIEWQVTWRGSGGTGGTLPAITTQASSLFVVQQVQVVSR